MTGTLQTYARKHTEAIDLLKYEFTVQKELDAEEVTHPPEDGILIYGLFIEGARWSSTNNCLEDQVQGEMNSRMPIIHFRPAKDPKLQVNATG